MSYAIVRNEKLTRAEINGKCTHNDRKAKNHTNKDIDPTRTHLNYYLKKNSLTYTKEFDKYRKETNVVGHLRSNSIVMCKMIFTSEQAFFDRIGEQETKRYFDECYKFICNYKNLGEKNIIAAVVHLDEGAPHMHLMYVPVVHTKDKDGNDIDKICARDFWKGRDSYRNLQNAYFEHVKGKGFDLERGLFVEETKRKHFSIEEYKNITNYAKTKETLENIKLELPEVPEIKDFKKVMLNRDEKIENQIIKPKDKLIRELYQDNLSLHKELSKQANLVDVATDFAKEKRKLSIENQNLQYECKKLSQQLESQKKKIKNEYEDKIYDIEYSYRKKINHLEKENTNLKKMIDKFKVTLHKFIRWITRKFELPFEDEIVRDFEKETHLNLDKELDLKHFQKKEKEFDREY